jgi:hypothetical protein
VQVTEQIFTESLLFEGIFPIAGNREGRGTVSRNVQVSGVQLNNRYSNTTISASQVHRCISHFSLLWQVPEKTTYGRNDLFWLTVSEGSAQGQLALLLLGL